ncbi:type II toxin-antitoxin system RelE/ParE family toxin [Streptomyces nojiriensis]
MPHRSYLEGNAGGLGCDRRGACSFLAAHTASRGSADTHPDQQGHHGLETGGPGHGPPLVDTVEGSQLANLKELRPGSSGDSEVGLLFVFDPLRRAVFLVGGNKAGNRQSWYRSAIPRAEKAYEDYLTQSEEETP